MGNLYIGLLHYPVRNAQGEIIATSLTGLDLHDLARSARTFEVSRFYLITPLASQRRIASSIISYWLVGGGVRTPRSDPLLHERTPSPKAARDRDETHRAEALQLARVVATLEDSLADLQAIEAEKPLLVATSARRLPGRVIGFEELRRHLEESPQPVYVVFGTGWGIADELIPVFDALLPPIMGPGSYNHLSVRAAAAIVLDRLRGRRRKEKED